VSRPVETFDRHDKREPDNEKGKTGNMPQPNVVRKEIPDVCAKDTGQTERPPKRDPNASKC
jgi:hypothetical protein